METVNENMAWKPNINHEELYDRYESEIKKKNNYFSFLSSDDEWTTNTPWIEKKKTKEEYVKNVLEYMEDISYHFDDSELDILTNIWIAPHSDKGEVDEEFTAFYILKSNGHYLNDIPFQSGDILIVNIHDIHSVTLKDSDETMLLSQNGIKNFIDKHMMVASFFNFNSSDNMTKKDIEDRFVSMFENDKKLVFSI